MLKHLKKFGQEWMNSAGKTILSIALLSTITTTCMAQAPYWLLPGKKLSFTNGTHNAPTATTVSASQSPSNDYAGNNAWLNADGTVRFFLSRSIPSSLSVKKPDGTSVGILSVGSGEHPEILIIPRPQTCNEFYLVTTNNWVMHNIDIDYYILNTSTWNLSGPYQLLSTTNDIALATSKPKSNGNSYVYAVGPQIGVYKFDVTNSGITSTSGQSTINSSTTLGGTPVNFVTNQVEIAYNGDAIAWGARQTGGDAKIFWASLSSTTGDYLPSTGPLEVVNVAATNGRTAGVEFSPNSSNVVFASVGTTTAVTGKNNGLVRIDFSTNSVFARTNTHQYANSQLQNAHNNTVVAASANNLGFFNSWTLGTAGTVAISALPFTFFNVYVLPQQINGYLFDLAGPISGPVTVYLAGTAQNNPATYTVPLTSGLTYSWSINPSATLTPNQNSVTVNFPASGNYTLIMEANPVSGSCAAAQFKYLFINVQETGSTDPPGDGSRMAIAIADVSIYPNPAAGSFTIAVPANGNLEMVDLYDLSGRLVRTYMPAAARQQLPLDGLANGVYTVHIKSSEGNFIERLVVAR